jgi:hypothetical protein
MMPFLSADQFARKSDAERRQLLPLGYHPGSKDVLYLHEADRLMFTYGMGVTGTGKSRWMQGLILHDAGAGNGVIYVDPNGDGADHVVASMPADKLAKTYVLDMDDEEYPFGLNMFSLSGPIRSNRDRELAAARIEHVFHVLWPETKTQANIALYLPALVDVFLDNPGATLVDMLRFLQNKDYRAKMLRNVKDPMTLDHWRTYDGLGQRDQEQKVQALITRLGTLFVGRPTLRNVLGQRRTTISFRKAIENREIILIKLPIRQSTKNAEIIGTILLAQISAAIFSFSDLPDNQRPGVSLYVDEVQNFAGEDFKTLLAEGRKYGARITIAHQWREQLPDFLQKATMTARTKVVFQTSPEDSREMASLFPAQSEEVKPDDISATVDKVLRTRTSNFPPVVQQFVHTYLIPLQSEVSGGHVDIGERYDALKIAIYGLAQGKENKWVDDPTDRLNGLLYECMRSGNANLPIPWEVAVGFSTTGGGFFSAVKHRENAKFMPGYQFPPHLVHNGSWTHRPESTDERLIHFVFHLRQTMAYLAAHPEGKKTQANNAVVAQWISQLPRRMAYVRLGDEIGMIKTLDTPPELTGSELARRVQAIQTQTREKYCHSVAQVASVLTIEPGQEPTPTIIERGVHQIAGWGRVGEP